MRVLIVEDDRHIAENLYDFLEACGHQCDFTTSLTGGTPESPRRRHGTGSLIFSRRWPAG